MMRRGEANLMRRRAGGFTILETLIVVGLIGLLVTLSVVVGSSVIEQAKVRQTRQLLDSLNSLVDAYQTEYGGNPPFNDQDFAYDDLNGYMTTTSDSNVDLGEVRPEVAVFIEHGRGLAGFDAVLASIPPEYLLKRCIWPPEPGEEPEEPSLYYQAIGRGLVLYSGHPPRGQNDERLTVRDAWGMEVLYVHPHDQRATSNSSGDARGLWTGYGRPTNNRPYFISAGPDAIYYGVDDVGGASALVGTEDNIYSYPVDKPESDG